MDEETARKVYECALAFDPLLGRLGEAVDAIEDEGLRLQLKKAVGDLMGALFAEVMHPLELRFPVLTPEHERPG